jgi:nitrogen fixation protein NifB
MPGYTSKLLQPIEALNYVDEFISKNDNLSVIGIAGPGDPLANPDRVFKTFSLIKEHYPDLLFCLSTNGLNVAQYISEIVNSGITHITVTLNAIDPEISQHIYKYIYYKGIKYTGLKASTILYENQLKGIKLLVGNNIKVKINTILIPTINDKEIGNISQTIKDIGVNIHNITGLIVKKEHNTPFSKMDLRAPSDAEIVEAQKISASIFGSFSFIMKHCKQCRADSAGLLTKENNIEFSRS